MFAFRSRFARSKGNTASASTSINLVIPKGLDYLEKNIKIVHRKNANVVLQDSNKTESALPAATDSEAVGVGASSRS